MFERFTQPARHVVVVAADEARGLHHGFVGTEHLLLGLAAVEPGLAFRLLDNVGLQLDGLRQSVAGEPSTAPPGIDAAALAAIGIDLEAVRRRVDDAFGPGALERGRACVDGSIPLRPEAKRALELALREAQSLGHDYIGTEHLLLGLTRGRGPAHDLLEAYGLSYLRVRSLVLEALAA